MENFEVIIIGGSFAGLSAAMSLGRSLRKVLVIDAGKPCNIQSPNAHNLLTQDGDTPEQILSKARNKIFEYPNITLLNGLVVNACQIADQFQVEIENGNRYSSSKLIIATGVKDILPDIPGFKECWGKSILHCPYCHGYEFKKQPTAVYGESKYVYHMSLSLLQWTHELHVLIDGTSTLNNVQSEKLKSRQIDIREDKLINIVHQEGKIQFLEFKNAPRLEVEALYAKPRIRQNLGLEEQLNYNLTDKGLIEVDILQKTTVKGIFACGDNSTHGRSIAMAISTGSLAGIMCNKELIEDQI
jgi:thioredoxin reductase